MTRSLARKERSLRMTRANIVSDLSRSTGETPVPTQTLCLHFGVAVGFVEQAQALHQQALGRAGDGGLAGGFGEVDLEAATGPSHGLVDGLVALGFSINGVVDLALTEEHVALLAIVRDGEQAALASHLERLQ